jgi:hypothetical protein
MKRSVCSQPAPRRKQGLPARNLWWDDASMSEKQHQNPPEPSHHVEGYAGSPTTQQMRTVGQRRRDAEEKLEHHLEEARHKDHRHDDDTAQKEGTRKENENTKQEQADAVEGPDVAAIQNDDALTAADRVDLIANQVVPEAGESDKPDAAGKP